METVIVSEAVAAASGTIPRIEELPEPSHHGHEPPEPDDAADTGIDFGEAGAVEFHGTLEEVWFWHDPDIVGDIDWARLNVRQNDVITAAVDQLSLVIEHSLIFGYWKYNGSFYFRAYAAYPPAGNFAAFSHVAPSDGTYFVGISNTLENLESEYVVSIAVQVDSPPDAKNDTATTPEDIPVTIPVLANDEDLDGNIQAITAVGTPAHGEAVVNAGQTITYTPVAGFVGKDAFSYTVVDGTGLVDTAEITVFVGPRATPIDLADVAAGAGGFTILGEANYDWAGWSVSGAGDVNDDGLADLVVGAPYNDGGGSSAGAAYVVFGKADTEPVDLEGVAAGIGGYKIEGENKDDLGGACVSGGGDVDGDGRPDLIVGAGGNDAGGTNAGAAYVVFGTSDTTAVDLDSVADDIGGIKIIGEDRDDRAGGFVAAAGDVNGDGLDDILVNADNGDAYVVFGAEGMDSNVDLGDVAGGVRGFRIASLDGGRVSAAGDVNGDGLDDVLIGAPLDSQAGSKAGAAYVVFGKTDTATVEAADVASGSGGFKILGEDRLDGAGFSVFGPGDVNGDGLADLLVGAKEADDVGAAYVVFGETDTVKVDLDDVAAGNGGFKIIGEVEFDDAGYSVSGVGDVNDDGLADVLVGAPLNDEAGSKAGAAYLVYGKADTTAIELVDIAAGIGGFKLIGASSFDEAGLSVSGAGDVNGDGWPDLIVGAPKDSRGGLGAGAAYVVFAPSPNHEPAAADDLAGTRQGVAATIAVLVNDSDVDGDRLTCEMVSAPRHGAAEINADHTVTYTPPPGFSGSDTFTYWLGDRRGLTDRATVTVMVGEAWSGSEGDDVRAGSEGPDLLDGGPGNDTLNGGEGDDALNGGPGDDVLVGGPGADELRGEGGTDTADYSSMEIAVAPAGEGPGGVHVNLARAWGKYGDAEGDVVLCENVIGTEADDVLVGNGLGNRLEGRGGDDVLMGIGGDNVLLGGAGVDRLLGGGGDDLLAGGAGPDELRGGGGIDTADYASMEIAVAPAGEGPGGVHVNLARAWGKYGDAEGDLVDCENVIGTDAADILVGNGLGNRFEGRGGDDVLLGIGGADADRLLGGAGDDLLNGGAGPDGLYGGPGDDTADYSDGAAGVHVNLAQAWGKYGDAEGDLVDCENVTGSGHDDILVGNGLGNRLEGRGGADKLLGIGGANVLIGGAGSDTCYGGAGADTFVLAPGEGGDVIHGFTPGTDTIGLAGGLAVAALTLTLRGGSTLIADGAELLATVIGADLAADDFAPFV